MWHLSNWICVLFSNLPTTPAWSAFYPHTTEIWNPMSRRWRSVVKGGLWGFRLRLKMRSLFSLLRRSRLSCPPLEATGWLPPSRKATLAPAPHSSQLQISRRGVATGQRLVLSIEGKEEVGLVQTFNARLSRFASSQVPQPQLTLSVIQKKVGEPDQLSTSPILLCSR